MVLAWGRRCGVPARAPAGSSCGAANDDRQLLINDAVEARHPSLSPTATATTRSAEVPLVQNSSTSGCVYAVGDRAADGASARRANNEWAVSRCGYDGGARRNSERGVPALVVKTADTGRAGIRSR